MNHLLVTTLTHTFFWSTCLCVFGSLTFFHSVSTTTSFQKTWWNC